MIDFKIQMMLFPFLELDKFQKAWDLPWKILNLLQTFLQNLILELNGLTVLPFSKLEINQIVDHVGLSELLKLCLTESVLLLTKPFKLEFHLKT